MELSSAARGIAGLSSAGQVRGLQLSISNIRILESVCTLFGISKHQQPILGVFDLHFISRSVQAPML